MAIHSMPMYSNQFLPRDKRPQHSFSLARRFKYNFRRQSAVKTAKRVTIFLAVVYLLVKFLIAPARAPGLHPIVPDSAGLSLVQSKEMLEKWGPQVEYSDFSKQTTSGNDAASQGERVLICMPLRNAEPVLDMMFSHLRNLTYPHSLIDLAFLVSDSTDNTYEEVEKAVLSIQTGQMPGWDAASQFNHIDVYKHDFGAKIGQGIDDRHGVQVQAVRRKLMGRARNWLLLTALKPQHSWVYWRDADIESSAPSIIEDLMAFNQDVIVPNVWWPLPEWKGGPQAYDLNSWQESDMAIELANTLNEDDVIVEGYAEYPTYRIHLGYLRDPSGNGNLYEMIPLDGIGGVSILAKAKVFRSGANFPGFAFFSHAETEGFGKMCRRMGFSVSGLTQYTVWHKWEPSEEDVQTMRDMESQSAAAFD